MLDRNVIEIAWLIKHSITNYAILQAWRLSSIYDHNTALILSLINNLYNY